MFLPYRIESDEIESKVERQPLATYALIGINVAVFCLCQIVPAQNLLLLFHRYGFVPEEHSVLTVFTHMFLHANVLHIAGNMYFLWLFGSALEKARAAAAKVAQRFGIRRISLSELKVLQDDQGKTTYLFDVRSPEEYAAGHLPGSISAPGGQLVQATDTFCAVHGARIALVDDHGVRATLTASWLLQMGWTEVFVVKDVVFDSLASAFSDITPHCPMISVQDLKPNDALVLDFGTSLQYRGGHIPGASFAIRSRLANHIPAYGSKTIVCTSPDGVLARYAASDLAGLLGREVRALEGGTDAWSAAGLPLEQGETRMLEPPEDVYYKPYDHKAQIEAAMQDYLQWEVALLEQIRRDPDCRFRDFPKEAQ